MATHVTAITDELYNHVLDVSLREAPILKALREETAGMASGDMQISPDQGQFMGFLGRLTGARRYLEVGTFTGYSSLAMALALPELQITCLDISEEWTAIARRYWEEAGVADRIDLRLAPSDESLAELARQGAAGTYDFCFVDADWARTRDYFEGALALVRQGGIVAVDNALMVGTVVEPPKNPPPTTTCARCLHG